MSRSNSVALRASVVVALAVATLPARAADDVIVATIDQAKLVKIPDGATTLIIGNPVIADVTQLMPNLMVLTPKAFGETNFIALDKEGRTVAGSMIQVVGGSGAIVVQRGMERQSYSCAPRCQPTERLGDDNKYMTGVASQAEAHFRRISGSTPPAAPPLTSTTTSSIGGPAVVPVPGAPMGTPGTLLPIPRL